jgi:GT2 family glycosyltransferase
VNVAGPRFLVYVAAEGNVFMQEIAGWIAAALGDEGHDAELRTEGVPRAGSGHVNLVVAPHEYFDLALRSDADRRQAALASVPVCTEQPETPWFEIQARHIAPCPLVLDINRLAVAEHRRWGIAADHFPLGYHRSFDVWGGDPDRQRPIDVVFLGALTPRRESALAKAAAHLSGLRCELLLFEPLRPARPGDPGFLTGRDKYELLASAKAIVNLHRNEVPYLEWVRVLEAASNGAVVVTEAVADYEPLRPVDHLVTTTSDVIGPVCRALTLDDDWRRRVSSAAYAQLRDHHTLAATLRSELPRIVAAATAGPPARRSRSVVVPARVLPGETVVSPVLPPSAESVAMRGLHKRVLTNQLGLRRRLERLEALVRHGDADAQEVTTTPAYDAITPEVTVVVPCFNYADVVGEAMESVVTNHGVVAELVVVDDHSTDASAEVVRRFAAAHAWFPMKLVSRATNRGLSASRNLGFSVARAELVFVLDADNQLYPTALAKLKRALDGSDASFAYAIAEVFGDRTALLSAIPWSVERLARGPYIDAAALIRRTAWAEAGGYATDVAELDLGWEDYDLWLRLADAGHHGTLVPEVLFRYRSHGASMVNTTNIETDSITRYFRRRYRNLPWPPLTPPGSEAA